MKCLCITAMHAPANFSSASENTGIQKSQSLYGCLRGQTEQLILKLSSIEQGSLLRDLHLSSHNVGIINNTQLIINKLGNWITEILGPLWSHSSDRADMYPRHLTSEWEWLYPTPSLQREMAGACAEICAQKSGNSKCLSEREKGMEKARKGMPMHVPFSGAGRGWCPSTHALFILPLSPPHPVSPLCSPLHSLSLIYILFLSIQGTADMACAQPRDRRLYPIWNTAVGREQMFLASTLYMKTTNVPLTNETEELLGNHEVIPTGEFSRSEAWPGGKGLLFFLQN